MGKPVSFREAMKKVNGHNIVMAVGNEPFYRDQLRNKIVSLNKDCDVVKLYCDELEEAQIFDRLKFKDLFGTKRVVILKNFTKIKKLDYFLNNKFTDVLILDSDKAGKSKLFKELQKKCLYVECIRPKPWDEERDAVGKIKGYLTNAGYSITENTSSYLYQQIGYDLYKLMNEMQKLIA